jgi:hypothetical protein
MQITVSCHRCHEDKRPLAPCPSCDAPALVEPELHAWRLSLHAEGLARITAIPEAAALPAERVRNSDPLRAVFLMDIEPREAPATIIPLEAPLAAEETLSFDWQEKRRRGLRRTA